MNCQNKLCAYYNANECMLDEISVDAYGMCADCICVEFEEDALELKRRAKRLELENTDSGL